MHTSNTPSNAWLPQDWGSKSAWLESAHHAARVFRRDVAQATPQQIRHAIEMASRLNPGPWGGDFKPFEFKDWRGAEVTWKEHAEGTVLWIHGGAFAFGSPRVYRAAAVHLARATRCRVILPKYRLAPNHVHPTAHDDVDKALGACVKAFGQVVLLGDSAGGNLALSACLRGMSSLHAPKAIAGLALLSPWCDLREEAASIQANLVVHSPFNHEDSLEYSRMYLAGHDASDARVSPLLSSSFEGLPSVYLEWALDEFLAPDIASLSQKMTHAGVALETRMEPQAVHGWQLLPDFLPEAKRSTAALGDWVRIRLGLQQA